MHIFYPITGQKLRWGESEFRKIGNPGPLAIVWALQNKILFFQNFGEHDGYDACTTTRK